MASLDDWANALAHRMDGAVANVTREEELRLAVHQTIVDAGSELFGISGWPDAERNPAAGSRRAYDNLYGGAVIEWEWMMGAARREQGAQQALDYLELLRSEAQRDEAFTAVVCDGREWGFLTVDPVEPLTLFEEPPSTAAEHFIWETNSPAAARRFLQLIGTHRQVPVTAASLSREFGPASEHARRLIVLLTEALAGRDSGSRADVLYMEWRRALDVVYGELDQQSGDLAAALSDMFQLRQERTVGETLFVLHTYFALIARLTAVEVLAIAENDRSWQPSHWIGATLEDLVARIRDLEEGRLPGGLAITNLFEADVFSWWSTNIEGDSDLQAALSDVLDALSRLAFPRIVHGPQIAADVLADLYQAIVPRELRRRLGEFLTPQWLAEACLERLVDAGADVINERVADVTCGTGTFLTPVLTRKLSGLRGTNASAQDVQAVLDQVIGIDLNPVSVIACRANFVVGLGPLASVGELTLRVWRADSLLVPDAPPRQGRLDEGRLSGRNFRELPTSLPEPFPVPALLTTAERMDVLCRLVADAVEEPDREFGRQLLLGGLTARFGPGAAEETTGDESAWQGELDVADELFSRIRDLQEQGKDGVWAQIIANAYAPQFAGTFGIVVGNPPWLAWGKLPESWRRSSERLWRRYGLWSLPREPAIGAVCCKCRIWPRSCLRSQLSGIRTTGHT